ncbi:MAG TPA: hypothetical protein VG294_07555 [Solirubrobacteraceae bacterium]|jgi:hypothetical protein|nr:hypothetical protein [Solirubrobacteraceae bacterium]
MNEGGSAPYRYRHLGVTIACDSALPRLAPAVGPVDLVLEVVRGDRRPTIGPPWTMVDPPLPAWRAPGAGGTRVRLQFDGDDGAWLEFLVDGRGDRVRMSLSADADLAEAVQVLIGSVFSCVLAQRGRTCLHASVVARDGRAVALVGPKRSGKSTLALACVQRGARVLADDVAAISIDDGLVTTAVGHPRLRVGPDSAAAFSLGYGRLRPIWKHEEGRPRKRYHEVAHPPTASSPVPLAGIYLLAPRGDALSTRSLTPGDMLPRLIANRHMATLLDRDGHRRDFACLAAIAAHVPGRELLRPDDLASTYAAAELVLAG